MTLLQEKTKVSAEQKRFASFMVAGGIAAAVNIGARYLLSMTMMYEAAVVVAYLIGMTTAFLLNRRFVFAPTRSHWTAEYGRFALVNAVAGLQVLIVSILLARVIFPWAGFRWHAEDIAHIIAVLSPIISSYYGHKHFSFRTQPS